MINGEPGTVDVWGDGRGVAMTIYVLSEREIAVRWTTERREAEAWLYESGLLRAVDVLKRDGTCVRFHVWIVDRLESSL